MQAQAQFSPDQLIIAGRRAEAQGQPAYALQFYNYIAEHFPASTEAFEARDAIYRLSAPQGDAHGTQGYAPAAAPSLPPAPTLDAGGGPSHGQHGQPGQAVGGRRAGGRKRKASFAADAADDDREDVPRYRVGRFVAMMLGTMGWLMLVASVVAIPVIMAALTVKSLPKGLRDTIAGNLIGVGGVTFGLLMLGLFAIFAGQVARATFDTADAVHRMGTADRGTAPTR